MVLHEVANIPGTNLTKDLLWTECAVNVWSMTWDDRPHCAHTNLLQELKTTNSAADRKSNYKSMSIETVRLPTLTKLHSPSGQLFYGRRFSAVTMTPLATQIYGWTDSCAWKELYGGSKLFLLTSFGHRAAICLDVCFALCIEEQINVLPFLECLAWDFTLTVEIDREKQIPFTNSPVSFNSNIFQNHRMSQKWM